MRKFRDTRSGPASDRVGMHPVLATELCCRCAGIELLENGDDLRLREAALTHVRLLAGLYARNLTVSACPNLPPHVISMFQWSRKKR